VSRHERDLVSLMLGLLTVLLAGLFLVTDLADLSFDGRWVFPVLLIGVGAVGLLGTLRSRTNRPGAEANEQEQGLSWP
jgi:hypothetical protein